MLSNPYPQVEMTHNALLDACERFREDMGEVADNVSLATALETLWAERVEKAAASSEAPADAPCAILILVVLQ